MTYKVVIPTAGLGSRLGKLTKNINKSLISVSNKPIISWQFEKFNNDCEFIIPLGYKGNFVKEFLELVYPEREINFIKIENFEGTNSGLGHTLLQCEKYLKEKFIFLACDCMFTESIPDCDTNWLGYSLLNSNNSEYRTLEIIDGKAKKIHEKSQKNSSEFYPYIGMCNIINFDLFWDALKNRPERSIEEGEAFGINALLEENLEFTAIPFTWSDTGSIKGLKAARKIYKIKSDLNILEKENEHIWFIGEKVIKFSTDKNFIKNRVKRVNFLKGYVPDIVKNSENMYLYEKFNGEVFSSLEDINKFKELLSYSKKFWKKYKLDAPMIEEFESICKTFYKDKTIKRIKAFYKNFKREDNLDYINGRKVKRLNLLIKLIDWQTICRGLPVRYHGDFHFENILVDNNRFLFIDWRQDFGGNLKYGDIYYDLSKLLHGLIVNHSIIKQNQFEVIWNKNELNYSINKNKFQSDCERVLFDWLKKEKLDIKKVNIITALIFLNIASLHHYPYCLLLYGLGIEKLDENV